MHYSVGMTYKEELQGQGRSAYRRGATASANPHRPGSPAWVSWDAGFWAEHDDASDAAPITETSGMEEGYGNWLDTDAVSQGFYDDDPSPYDGNYSED